jgi:type I restriction enzyme S subunit
MRRRKVEVMTGYTRFQEGDILLPKITPTFEADRTVIVTGLEGRVGVGTTELHVVRVLGAEPRYVRYLLSTRSFLAEGEAAMIGVAGQKRVPEEHLRNWPIPIDDLSQQRAIADYLDQETARIDALIVAKRRMIELLEEREDALREIVVKRLIESAPLRRLQHLLVEADERLGSAEPLPLLSVSIHFGVIPFAEAHPDRVPRADELTNYKRCRTGDIVLNRMRAFQGGLGFAPIDGIVSPDYAVLRPTKLTVTAYVYQLLRSPWFVGQMEAWLRGIGSSEQGNVRTPRVNWTDLRTVLVPCPPVDEQVVVASEMAGKLAVTRVAQQRINASIALLLAKRQTLITAAVAGEIVIARVTT